MGTTFANRRRLAPGLALLLASIAAGGPAGATDTAGARCAAVEPRVITGAEHGCVPPTTCDPSGTPGSPIEGDGECSGFPAHWAGVPGNSTLAACCICHSAQWFCPTPRLRDAPYIAKADPLCDPRTQSCSVQLRVPLEFPGTKQNNNSTIRPRILWFQSASSPTDCVPNSAPFCNAYRICGVPGFGVQIDDDFGETSLHLGQYSCTTALTASADYSLLAFNGCTSNGACRRSLPVDGMHVGGVGLAASLGCPIPPPVDCTSPPNQCRDCRPAGGGCSVSPEGHVSCQMTLSGAHLRYRSGGAGGTNFPGTTGAIPWRTTLGLYWSHDYAQRIVVDNVTEGINHVWLITEGASFREFKTPAAGGGLRLYDVNLTAPSDEYRRLYFNTATSGWQLDYLDGRRDVFRSDGLWERTIWGDPTAPYQSKTSIYSGTQLTDVNFPDGRKEKFEYTSGKLTKLSEMGFGITDCVATPSGCRVWTFVWSGDELVRINRPDTTTWELTYNTAMNGNRPGYLTQVRLLSSGGGLQGRVEAAFEYHSSGRVLRNWRGDPSFSGANAVDKQEFLYTNPTLPTQVVVTEWVNDTTRSPPPTG